LGRLIVGRLHAIVLGQLQKGAERPGVDIDEIIGEIAKEISDKARAEGFLGPWIEALDGHGVRYRVIGGDVYIDGQDCRNYNRLCDEGKLSGSLC